MATLSQAKEFYSTEKKYYSIKCGYYPLKALLYITHFKVCSNACLLHIIVIVLLRFWWTSPPKIFRCYIHTPQYMHCCFW